MFAALYTAGSALKQGARILSGSYSQSGQDVWVLRALQGKRSGFFVELGAGRPRWGNNTWLLENRYGWSGICIEPDPELFRSLSRHRRCRSVRACVDAQPGMVQFFRSGIYSGLVEGYSPSHRINLRRYAGVPNTELPHLLTESLRMPSVTLAQVLEEQGAPPVIDYLSLDTEGSEYRILSTFPFERYTFRVLTVEHYGLRDVKHMQRELLRKNGYELSEERRYDDFYMHAGSV